MALGRSVGARVGGEAASLKGPKAKAHWAWPLGLFRDYLGGAYTAAKAAPQLGLGVGARGLGRTQFLTASPIRNAGSALGGVRVSSRAVLFAVAPRAACRAARRKASPR